MSEIKIFKLNDCDWWAGEDLDSVKSAYLREMDITDLQGIESAFDDPRELFDEEMDRLKFVDGDDPINADGTPGGTLTFRAALSRCIERGDTFPQLFASTEF